MKKTIKQFAEMQILQIKLQPSKSDEEKANLKTLQTEQKSLHSAKFLIKSFQSG